MTRKNKTQASPGFCAIFSEPYLERQPEDKIRASIRVNASYFVLVSSTDYKRTDILVISPFFTRRGAHKECMLTKGKKVSLCFFFTSITHLFSLKSGAICSNISMLNDGLSVMCGTSSKDSSSPGDSCKGLTG